MHHKDQITECRTTIVVSLQLEGLHHWPDASEQLPEVGYLSDLHRHIFYIRIEKDVYHADRDVEIIMFKRRVEDYLRQKYWNAQFKCLNFEQRSCEMIAQEIAVEFECSVVEVLEDNENGARVYYKMSNV